MLPRTSSVSMPPSTTEKELSRRESSMTGKGLEVDLSPTSQATSPERSLQTLLKWKEGSFRDILSTEKVLSPDLSISLEELLLLISRAIKMTSEEEATQEVRDPLKSSEAEAAT